MQPPLVDLRVFNASRPIRIRIDVDLIRGLKGILEHDTPVSVEVSAKALQGLHSEVRGSNHPTADFFCSELHLGPVHRQEIASGGYGSKRRVLGPRELSVGLDLLVNLLDSRGASPAGIFHPEVEDQRF